MAATQQQHPVFPEDIADLTPIRCADGQVRHLRFTLGAKKRIADKFGANALEMLKQPPEQLLPFVLAQGLVEREGVDEESIMEKLITAPMVDYATECFVRAFFAPRSVKTAQGWTELAMLTNLYPDLLSELQATATKSLAQKITQAAEQKQPEETSQTGLPSGIVQ